MTISKVAPQIVEHVLSDSSYLKEYSEKSSLFIYDWLSDFIRYADESEEALAKEIEENTKFIRDCSAFDKLSSDFIADIRAEVDKKLRELGFVTSGYGYWFKGKNPLIAFWHREIRDAFEGTVLSTSSDTCSYVTGETFLEDWETWDSSIDCYPSSPYEAFELASECDGFFETEWQYVLSNLREEMCSLDLTEYEDVDEVLTQVEFGLCFEDFPRDYREQLTDMFEEMKEEHAEEEEIEEEWE